MGNVPAVTRRADSNRARLPSFAAVHDSRLLAVMPVLPTQDRFSQKRLSFVSRALQSSAAEMLIGPSRDRKILQRTAAFLPGQPAK
jgi:hypothetical protein